MIDSLAPTLTPAQVRGARAMLQITQEDLAARAGVPRSALAEFEAEERRPRPATLEKLRAVLEAAGAAFVESDVGSGVIVRDVHDYQRSSRS